MNINKNRKAKIYGWFLIILGFLLVCWVIFDIIAEFTHLNAPNPLRSALTSREASVDYPISTLVMMWIMWTLWSSVGSYLLYSGIKRISRPNM